MSQDKGKPTQAAEVARVEPASGETLEAFKASFAYGSRTDLLFKFIKNLEESEAAEFLRALLEKLGQTLDDGNTERIHEHLYENIVRAYAHERHDRWSYDEGPFTPLAKRYNCHG